MTETERLILYLLAGYCLIDAILTMSARRYRRED